MTPTSVSPIVMREVAASLREAVDGAMPLLHAITESASAVPPAPGKWCAREIIGHLIDSATNNHSRFVRAQLAPHLDFDGYEQEGWVSVQRYADASWTELVTFWRAYNAHIARIIAVIPDEVARTPRTRHSLDRIASRLASADEPQTLAFLAEDYVFHLEHHLRQLRALGP